MDTPLFFNSLLLKLARKEIDRKFEVETLEGYYSIEMELSVKGGREYPRSIRQIQQGVMGIRCMKFQSIKQ